MYRLHRESHKTEHIPSIAWFTARKERSYRLSMRKNKRMVKRRWNRPFNRMTNRTWHAALSTIYVDRWIVHAQQGDFVSSKHARTASIYSQSEQRRNGNIEARSKPSCFWTSYIYFLLDLDRSFFTNTSVHVFPFFFTKWILLLVVISRRRKTIKVTEHGVARSRKPRNSRAKNLKIARTQGHDRRTRVSFTHQIPRNRAEIIEDFTGCT